MTIWFQFIAFELEADIVAIIHLYCSEMAEFVFRVQTERRFGKSSENDMTSQPFYFPGGLSRVCDVVTPDEFEIRVNGESFLIPLVEAVFLSPRVFSVLKTDKTVRLLEIENSGIDAVHLGNFVELVEGKTVNFTSSSRFSLIRLSTELGNPDLTRIFFGLHSDTSITQPLKSSVGFDLTIERREDLFLLDFDTLEMILTNESLRIESEDWLMELILELGEDFRGLLNHVKYEFLSLTGLFTFLDNFNHWEITGDIWASLVRRLRDEKSPSVHLARYGTELISHQNLSSTIVSEFPRILSVIEEKNARLLYRGTRDGFKSCYNLVNGHSNFLILVESTEGWIFGG
jgi:hypothetical protein